MKLLKNMCVFALAVSLLLLSACGGGQPAASSGSAPSNTSQPAEAKADSGKTYNFKMTHITQPTHVWHMFAEKLAEELDTRSNGRMKMEIFPAGQLGPEKDMVQQLETGTIQFALITAPYLSSRVPAISAWNMPFLFPTLEAAVAAADSEPAKKILKPLQDQGMIPMGYMFSGNHHLLMKEDEVTSAEGVKGKKLRVTGGPALLEFWAEAGASPVAMGLPEVYGALQTGVVDGISIDAIALLSEKFYEVADEFILTNQMAFPGIFVASKTVYEQMPAEDQKIVDEAVKAAAAWGNQELLRLDEESKEKLKEHLTITDMVDKDSFNQARDKIYQKYSEDPMIKEFIEINSK